MIQMLRDGQNSKYTPYMTVYLEISQPKLACITVCIWFWPILIMIVRKLISLLPNISVHTVYAYVCMALANLHIHVFQYLCHS